LKHFGDVSAHADEGAQVIVFQAIIERNNFTAIIHHSAPHRDWRRYHLIALAYVEQRSEFSGGRAGPGTSAQVAV